MSCFDDKWSKRWEEKRDRILNKKFNIKTVINHQYYQKNYDCQALGRDIEMKRLKNFYVFSPSTNNLEEEATPVLSSKFCPLSGFNDLVASVTEDGSVYISKSVHCKPETTIIKAHNNAIFDLMWVPGEKKLITLSGDLTARLWDVGQDSMNLLSVFVGHRKSVKSAAFIPDDPDIFASGSRDGNIHVWDLRSYRSSSHQFKPDQTITLAAHKQRKGKQQNSSASVTSLVYRDKHNLYCSGATDEFIRIWDMRKTHCAWKITEPKGFLRSGRSGYTDLKLNNERTKMYASSIYSSIFSFNLNSSQESPIAEFQGHQSGTFYIRISVSNDGAFLASGSMDKNLYVWKTKSAELQGCSRTPMLCLSGHRGEVTGVDIDQSIGTTIVSCGDDGTVRTWTPTACDAETTSNDMSVFGQSKCLSLVNFKEVLVKEREHEPDSNNSGEAQGKENERSLMESKRNVTNKKNKEWTPPRPTVRADELNASAKRKLHETSPVRTESLWSASKRHVLSPSKSNSEYRSPTMNLPNYVLEGTGPSHSCPSFKQKESKNWLLEIRERSAGKQSASSEKNGRKQKSHNLKRSSRKTLLEYYKKSSKSLDDSIKK